MYFLCRYSLPIQFLFPIPSITSFTFPPTCPFPRYFPLQFLLPYFILTQFPSLPFLSLFFSLQFLSIYSTFPWLFSFRCLPLLSSFLYREQNCRVVLQNGKWSHDWMRMIIKVTRDIGVRKNLRGTNAVVKYAEAIIWQRKRPRDEEGMTKAVAVHLGDCNVVSEEALELTTRHYLAATVHVVQTTQQCSQFLRWRHSSTQGNEADLKKRLQQFPCPTSQKRTHTIILLKKKETAELKTHSDVTDRGCYVTDCGRVWTSSSLQLYRGSIALEHLLETSTTTGG